VDISKLFLKQLTRVHEKRKIVNTAMNILTNEPMVLRIIDTLS